MLSEGDVIATLAVSDIEKGKEFYGGKLGIDATAKWPEEGARPWPEEIEMSAEVKDLVTRRWNEYGLR